MSHLESTCSARRSRDEEDAVCVDSSGSIRTEGETWVVGKKKGQCAQCKCKVRAINIIEKSAYSLNYIYRIHESGVNDPLGACN